MKELGHILSAFKNLSNRLVKLESIGIPKDGKDGRDGRDFTFDMFTPEQLEILRGEKGADGRNGIDGAPGRNGIDGRNGRDGVPGKNGKNGLPGKDGRDGAPGRDGVNGINGRDGQDGEDGRGIDDAYIDKDGHLIIVFTDGEKKDVGKVKGEDGKTGYGIPGSRGPAGTGIETVEVDKNGHLIVTTTDGRDIDAGKIPGGGGSGTGNVSSDTINTIWTGTLAEYEALDNHSNDTLYIIIKPRYSFYNTRIKFNTGMKYNGAK